MCIPGEDESQYNMPALGRINYQTDSALFTNLTLTVYTKDRLLRVVVVVVVVELIILQQCRMYYLCQGKSTFNNKQSKDP